MMRLKISVLVCVISVFLTFLNSCADKSVKKSGIHEEKSGNFYIGWSSVDITPDKPVVIPGGFAARVSEGVADPITVTALALESGTGPSSEKAIMISCDLLLTVDDLHNNVRKLLEEVIPDLRYEQLFINSTHTHASSDVSPLSIKDKWGIELNALEPKEYLDFLSARIVLAARQAWENRKPGGISYGLGYAVAGNNRLQVDFKGAAQMHGNINRPEFSHLEGYVDHSVNLLYTWDADNKLTGVVINIPCTSQVKYGYLISSDFWHDTRVELGKRLGNEVHILPQSSPGGDLSPHDLIIDRKAEERMQSLMFPGVETGKNSTGRRKQIALRISDAVTSVLPYMKDSIEWDPVFTHKMEVVEISRRLIGIEDVNAAVKESEDWRKKYEQALLAIKQNPALKEKPRWYSDVTNAYTHMGWGKNVKSRYELEKVQPKLPIEIHVIRIGDIVFATNPFELYLDYGIRIKARSQAVQTFLVQLTGSYKGYLPTSRAVAGGGYGAVPASTQVGPEGGQEVVENTLKLINTVWQK